MKFINFIALMLIIVGALNWGLWGFFQFDLVAWLFNGNTSGMSRLVYGIIGLAGVWGLGFLGRCRAICCGSCACNCDKCGCGKGKGKGGSCRM
jgi:uncharacterized membrane protein YuzA (DUF378 family)